MCKNKFRLAMLVLAAGITGPAIHGVAQTRPEVRPPQRPPAAPEPHAQSAAPVESHAPQRTTATYDDWTERCEIVGASKTCEMAQAMQVQGQSQPIAQIAIGQENKSAPMKIVFQVPINIWVPGGVKLVVNDKDPVVAASFTRCLPLGCFADIDIKDDQIRQMRAAPPGGKLQFQDAAQREVAIPVSFKGFDQAYQAIH